MKKNNYPGHFIVFEGLDGSGQTTQTGLLSKFLRDKGILVLATKEPTQKSKFSRTIQEVLEKKKSLSPRELQKAFSQDRAWHLKHLILPALKSGKTVICDRYLFSTLAYGLSYEVSLEFLMKLNKKFLLPDLVFFLDAKPDICLKRIQARERIRSIFETKENLQRIYKNYREVLDDFSKSTKILFIDDEQPLKEVFREVRDIVKIAFKLP